MRRSLAIVKATALEILSEPLTLLILLSALVLTVVMPVFHYHQFGEATRMARDAGLSALFSCGVILAVFSTIRSFRREIETGTFEMALAHPLSRERFFYTKTLGAILALLVFVFILAGATITSVIGAEIGGRLAERTGDIARIWGPCVAAGLLTTVGSLVVGAALNRFARFRFVLSSVILMTIFSLSSAAIFSIGFDGSVWARLLPAILLLTFLEGLFVVIASVSAVRLKANAAATVTGLLLVCFLPFLGNYYCADRLANGGVIPWSFVGLAALALLPAFGGFFLCGARLSRGID